MKHEWSRKKINLLADRDPETWEEFFEDYGQRLFEWCGSLTRDENEALDLYQDVLLEVFQSVSRLREPARLSAFLYQIVRNVWKTTLRNNVRRKRREEQAQSQLRAAFKNRTDIPSPEALLIADESFGTKLQRLTRREWEVFIYYLSGLSQRQIAETTGIRIETVRVHLHNTISKLSS